MNFNDVTVVSIIGKRNAGKTTLISELIPKLKEHNHLVGTLKYNIRKFEIDHKGKDTYKYFHSGADTVAISSQKEVAVIRKVKNTPEIKEIIKNCFNDVSVVLIEGYWANDYPCIRITDSNEATIVENGPNKELLLKNEHSKTKGFSAKDIRKALDFIENIVSLKKNI